jgi:uncharacterized protein YrrD
MSTIAAATSFITLPVVTLDGGDDVAEVKDVVYDADGARLIGFTLNKRGWFRGPMNQVLPWSEVSAIGRDAVMVRDTNSLTERDDAPVEVAEPATNRNVIGNVVLTDAGVELGRVADLIVELDDQATVVGYQLDPPAAPRGGHHHGMLLIPLPEQISVSGDALVVPKEVEPFIRDDLTGFGGAVESFRSQLKGVPPT